MKKNPAPSNQLALDWGILALPAPPRLEVVAEAPPLTPPVEPPTPNAAPGPDPVDRFIAYRIQRGHSKRTRRGTHYDLRTAERDMKIALLDATYPQLDAYFAGMTMRGLKAGTVKRHMANCRMFFKWCMRVDLLAQDPTIKLEAPKGSKRLPIHCSEDECDRLVADLDAARTAHELRDACAVALLFWTGMRAGELLKLNVEDWQPARGVLRVVGKGDKERAIPIAPNLIPYVERWLKSHPTGKGPLLVRWRAPWDRLRYPGLLDLFNAFKKRTAMPDGITPHKLRHTLATRLLHRGVPIDQLQVLLGHESVTTTSLYAHTRLDERLIGTLGNL